MPPSPRLSALDQLHLKPDLSHHARLHAFLEKAITELKSNAETPMPEPATILQSNAFKKDELVASLTGAGPLAAALTARIAAAKTKMSAANGRIDAAFSKLDQAEAAIESVAKKIETEADAAIAQVGQVSNLGS